MPGCGLPIQGQPRSVVNLPEASFFAASVSTDISVGRSFGRFKLLQLVGKSRRSMAWRVHDAQDTTTPREYFMLMPRAQPADAATAKH